MENTKETIDLRNYPPLTEFFAKQPVRKAYLFGSHARGEATDDSDIDFLLEVEDHVSLMGLSKIQRKLAELTDSKVDLVTTCGISKYIKPHIDEDKILIYEEK